MRVSLARMIFRKVGRPLVESCGHPAIVVIEEGKRLADVGLRCPRCGQLWKQDGKPSKEEREP